MALLTKWALGINGRVLRGVSAAATAGCIHKSMILTAEEELLCGGMLELRPFGTSLFHLFHLFHLFAVMKEPQLLRLCVIQEEIGARIWLLWLTIMRRTIRLGHGHTLSSISFSFFLSFFLSSSFYSENDL